MTPKCVKYCEGQWFAVPLRKGGYAIGIIVRGTYRTKGGLGYFFGPCYDQLPDDKDILGKKPDEPLLITQFSDLGIVNGRWPIIKTTRPFCKEEWPIPKFGSANPLVPQKAFIREYQQDNSGKLEVIRETVVVADEIVGMPTDSIMGGGAVEIRLSELLSS